VNKRPARDVRDLKPFVDTMTLAYRKGGGHEQSLPVKSETIFRASGHGSLALGWRGFVERERVTAVVPIDINRRTA
jgi:hypothetical protein